MTSRRTVLALVVLVGTVLPAVPAAGQADSREAGVKATLDQRVRAIRSGDRAAFLDTVEPGAGEDFRTRQARLFDGLRTLTLASFELRLRTDEVPDLSAGLRARYAADDVFLSAVEARYRIEGADRIDALDAFFYTFLLRDGRWRIASDTDVEDLGLPSSRNLWDFGPVALRRSAHFTLLFDPADRSRAEALLKVADQGFDRLASTFDRPLPEQVVVILPHSLDQLRDILQATFDLTNFVAFATASVDRDRGWESTAPRVYVQDANLANNPRAFQLETLHHELTHVAAFSVAGPFVPAWVHEGVADWMATGRGGPHRVEGSDAKLPDDYEFTTGGGDAIVRAYQESTSATAFLAEAKGRSTPLDLLVEAGRPRVAPGTPRYHVAQALRRFYRSGIEEFERTWNGGR
jgi:hypothetical protein